MINLIRLNKFIADSGVCSRRQADELILAGKVLVNNFPAQTGVKINPELDQVTVNGKLVDPRVSKIYYAVNKPVGFVSTAMDEKDRPKVVDLVPETPRVYPVGRLDADSEGLMILTNDGALMQELTHPSKKHQKEYEVKARISNQELRSAADIEQHIRTKFGKGLYIDGHLMRADSISVLRKDASDYLIIKIVLHTGYNRQVRKMCAKIGLSVVSLKRVRIAGLLLGELKTGEYKVIQKQNIIC